MRGDAVPSARSRTAGGARKSPPTVYPPAMIEEYWLPSVDRILDLVEKSLDY